VVDDAFGAHDVDGTQPAFTAPAVEQGLDTGVVEHVQQIAIMQSHPGYQRLFEFTALGFGPADAEQGLAGKRALEPHALHVVQEYAKWAAQEGDGSNSPFKGLDNLEALRRSGMFAVWTIDDLIANADKVEDRGTFGFQPLVGGFPPEEGWKSLELLKTAIPKLKALPR